MTTANFKVCYIFGSNILLVLFDKHQWTSLDFLTEEKPKESTRETFTNAKLENGVNHHSSDDNQSDSSENHKSPGLSGFQKTQTMREMLAGIPGISMKVCLWFGIRQTKY